MMQKTTTKENKLLFLPARPEQSGFSTLDKAIEEQARYYGMSITAHGELQHGLVDLVEASEANHWENRNGDPSP